MQMVFGYWVSQPISVVARLGVADQLAAGPLDAAALASRVGVHEESLFRILRALASAGVFELDDEGRFSLTLAGQLLRRDHPMSLAATAAMIGDSAHWLPWGRLFDCVRTGEPTAEAALGRPIWEHFGANPEEWERFDDAMAGMSSGIVGLLVEAYDFSRFECIVDVGGGRGVLLAGILERFARPRGVLFDLADTIDRARQSLAGSAAADRIELMAGSFFDGVPAGGDAYLLKHIIHDWNDDDATRILTNVRSAMNERGKVLLVEFVLGAGETPFGLLLDLNMMVLLGGRERTADEFGRLFARAGLGLERVVPAGGPLSVVEARAR